MDTFEGSPFGMRRFAVARARGLRRACRGSSQLSGKTPAVNGGIRLFAQSSSAQARWVIISPGQALADETKCRRTIGSRTVDNLRVPSGAKCVLTGTRVKGTIYVGARSVLKAKGVRVVGNIQAENSRKVAVRRGSRVGGSIQIVQGKAARIKGTRVKADILFDDQNGRVLAKGNRLGGNLQAFQNTGGVKIALNRIDGNLQCKENRPTPVGGNNNVQGSKEDQCSRL